MNPEKVDGDIGDDRDDLASQAVQEVFEFALICRHSEIKAMDAIFCGHGKLLSPFKSLTYSRILCLNDPASISKDINDCQ